MFLDLRKLVSRLVLGATIVSIALHDVTSALPVPEDNSSSRRNKRSDDAGSLQVVVDGLAEQIGKLNAQLAEQSASVQAQLSGLNAEVADLRNKTDTLRRTVAFYAWNNASPIRTTARGTLIFDHAETNVGAAYSPLTGVFTAPLSGLYHFQVTFLSTHLGDGHYAHASIYVDGKQVAKGISDTDHGQYDQTTISAIMNVSAGQQVLVKNSDNKANDYHGSLHDPHTTFSGFLLRAE